ncbi:MAG: hypothetical protein ABSF23_14135 [Terracidiphilus sp.]
MSANVLLYCCLFAAGLPFFAIAAILVHYCVRREAWKRKQRRGDRSPGFCPSSTALGAALLFVHVFVRPSLQHVLEEKQEEDKDEDDEGDPESPEKQLSRQLRDIRRGEKVDDLVLRM